MTSTTVVDLNDLSHTGMLRIGNDALDRWTMAPSLTDAAQILSTINHVDSKVVHTAYRPSDAPAEQLAQA